MDAIPWQTLTAAGGGWALFGATVWLVIRKLISGDLMTRREGEALETRIEETTTRAEKAEQANEALIDQNGQLMDMARLGTATWQALKKAAE